MQAILVTSFAAIAVILAVIGVYGLIAYLVTQRTHEIGIRLALGATARRIFGELVAEGAGLVICGLVAGLAAALMLRRLLSTLVFGITSSDPLTYLLATLAFLAIALAAVVVPARRGAGVEPINALRTE
jgi:putative ABC transport system permease protein